MTEQEYLAMRRKVSAYEITERCINKIDGVLLLKDLQLTGLNFSYTNEDDKTNSYLVSAVDLNITDHSFKLNFETPVIEQLKELKCKLARDISNISTT